MLTADTITIDQIRALRIAIESADVRAPDDYVNIDICDLALIPGAFREIGHGAERQGMTTQEARGRCAKLINALGR